MSEHEEDPRDPKYLKAGAALVVTIQILLWVITRTATAITESLHFRGFPADGPFQLLNPLRRIAAGQVGGVDFQYFHGLGLPYLHYPVYLFFGESVFASELSRYLISLTFFLGSTWFFLRSALPDRGRLLFAVGVALCLLSSSTLLYYPGNGGLGVRSTIPLLLAGVIAAGHGGRYRILLHGALLGSGFMIGTEHGMALAVAYVLYHFVQAVRERSLRSSVVAVGSLACATGIAAISYLSIGGWRGLTGAINFALRDLMMDQFWYFGSFPNQFIHSWAQIRSDWQITTVFPLAFLLLVVVVALHIRSDDPETVSVTGGLVIINFYGFISTAAYLGIATWGYFMPIKRVLVFSVIILAVLAGPFIRRLLPLSGKNLRSILYVLISLVAFIDIGFSVRSARETLPDVALLLNSGGATLSGRWRDDLELGVRTIEKRKGPRPPELWSTYSGLIEDYYGVFHPAQDYIIHALGPAERLRYIETFREVEPQFVQTMRRSLFRYEEWLQMTHWDFYEELIRNYDVAAMTSYSILWERRREPRELVTRHARNMELGSDVLTHIEMPEISSDIGVLILTIQYEIVNPWKGLPFFGKLGRHLVVADGTLNSFPVTLPPYRNTAVVPLFVARGAAPDVGFATLSLMPGMTIDIRSASATMIELPSEVDVIFTDRRPSHLRE